MNFSKRIQENVPLFEKKIIQFPLKIYNIRVVSENRGIFKRKFCIDRTQFFLAFFLKMSR